MFVKKLIPILIGMNYESLTQSYEKVCYILLVVLREPLFAFRWYGMDYRLCASEVLEFILIND